MITTRTPRTTTNTTLVLGSHRGLVSGSKIQEFAAAYPCIVLVLCAGKTADQMLETEKRFSEFLGGRRRRFSEFLGGKKRFSEFLGGRKRFSEFLGGKKRFSEFLGGKRNAFSLSKSRFT